MGISRRKVLLAIMLLINVYLRLPLAKVILFVDQFIRINFMFSKLT